MIMVLLTGRKSSMPERGDATGVEMDPSYRAWIETDPVPGEVFVDTGEASAADSRKLRWSPSKQQREMIREAITHEAAIVNELYQDEAQESYANHIEILVGETLRNVGVDPTTLTPLSDRADLPKGQ
jgi:hypothetical protein